VLGGLLAGRHAARPHGEAAVGVGVVGAALAVVGVVWATNLYNFMDGIDGLAGARR
jgi:UDP-N-acetylmuramyl pentapeptide phosphotransferase/UDP-N-acetylglucosamine-1-phosphate transferase